MKRPSLPVSALNPEELKLVEYIELQYTLTNAIPPVASCCKAVFGKVDGFSELRTDRLLKSPIVKQALADRGVKPGNTELTLEQIRAVATVLQTLDPKKPNKLSLKEAGISSAKWNKWRSDPVFESYLRQESEKVLANSVSDSLAALGKMVNQGDIKAIEMVLDITGRHHKKPDTQINFNSEIFLTRLLEILQEEIRDPITLERISQRIEGIVPAVAPSHQTQSQGNTVKVISNTRMNDAILGITTGTEKVDTSNERVEL